MTNMDFYIEEKQRFINEFYKDKKDITKSTYMDCYKFAILDIELKKNKSLCEFRDKDIEEVFREIKTISINVKRMLFRFINDYSDWVNSKLSDTTQYNLITASKMEELAELNLKEVK
ncbi:hypothetical protein [Clostridium sp.]|uniref:phage lytic cycle repressor MrpR family protein n=1 Tax=Clostridium sp. TaxID=1506 RepID=UPI003216E0BD